MPQSVNAASESIDAAINSIQSQLKQIGLTFAERPEFGPQGNYTLCQVKVRKIHGKKIYVGTAVSKRNCNDKINPIVGKQFALQRAVFGHHFLNCKNRKTCTCLRKSPFSVMAKLKSEETSA